MYETTDEVDALQAMFDAHLARANPHMTGIVTPERRLSARQVGEPRVSPLDALFIHGRFVMGTGGGATKVAHLRRNPACSAVHMDGDRIAVAVNGTVEWVTRDHPDHVDVHRIWMDIYGGDPYEWGDVVFFRVEPATMWAYAFKPGDFPES